MNITQETRENFIRFSAHDLRVAHRPLQVQLYLYYVVVVTFVRDYLSVLLLLRNLWVSFSKVTLSWDEGCIHKHLWGRETN